MRFAICLTLMLATSVAGAAPVLDAQNPWFLDYLGSGVQPPYFIWGAYGFADSEGNSGKSLAQTFRPTISGELTGLDLWMFDWQQPSSDHGSSALVQIWSTANGKLADDLADTTVGWREMQAVPFTTAGGQKHRDMLHLDYQFPTDVVAGQEYAIVITPIGDFRGLGVGYRRGIGQAIDVYSNGAAGWVVPPIDGGAIDNHLYSWATNADLGFRTWVDAAPTLPIAGDIDGNGKVDLTDFGILKDNFGKSGQATVPEPSTMMLLVVGVALLAARCYTR